MTDRISREKRSWNMGRIKGRDTAPELAVRSMLHGQGLRFRLHSRSLPGRPDIVLPRWQTVILIHGCFWHRHAGCRFAYTPKSRIEFWNAKFAQNTRRDERNLKALIDHGWRVVIIWECEVANTSGLARRLNRIFRSST
ncbi:MAG TPA: DNA mismatch endonuclease Vsr [Thermoanaerobaculia bacterium]|jgi:DNA mismatch endonuclease (patch repair protein)|nr:DNA mismatch endonuclease Vsr [Thermoanaerobaculia bacterium]